MASSPSSVLLLGMGPLSEGLIITLGFGSHETPPPPTLGQYSRAVLPAKAVGETLGVRVDFTSQLPEGEIIESAATVMTTYSGDDLLPEDMIVGSPSFTAQKVTQLITGGTEGNVYRFRTTIESDEGNFFTIDSFLVVVASIH